MRLSFLFPPFLLSDRRAAPLISPRRALLAYPATVDVIITLLFTSVIILPCNSIPNWICVYARAQDVARVRVRVRARRTDTERECATSTVFSQVRRVYLSPFYEVRRPDSRILPLHARVTPRDKKMRAFAARYVIV